MHALETLKKARRNVSYLVDDLNRGSLPGTKLLLGDDVAHILDQMDAVIAELESQP